MSTQNIFSIFGLLIGILIINHIFNNYFVLFYRKFKFFQKSFMQLTGFYGLLAVRNARQAKRFYIFYGIYIVMLIIEQIFTLALIILAD